jgi:hypothetical protein
MGNKKPPLSGAVHSLREWRCRQKRKKPGLLSRVRLLALLDKQGINHDFGA